MNQDISWNWRSEARRVIMADLRVMGIDMIYGVIYVAGAFFWRPSNLDNLSNLVAPTFALCFVTSYLTSRVCVADRSASTAMFFMNLPRNRVSAFWYHAISVGIYSLILASVIYAVSFIVQFFGFNAFQIPRGIQLIVYPWLCAALIMWLIYAMGKWIGKVRVLWYFILLGTLPAVFLIAAIIIELNATLRPLAIIVITAMLLLDGARIWGKFQIGELQ